MEIASTFNGKTIQLNHLKQTNEKKKLSFLKRGRKVLRNHRFLVPLKKSMIFKKV